jgi:hypothetical protein
LIKSSGVAIAAKKKGPTGLSFFVGIRGDAKRREDSFAAASKNEGA